MARDLNKVMLTGRLGADPEMRFTPQGSAVTTFRVASNRSWKSDDGIQHDDTEWFRIVAWDKLAEICNDYLEKGTHVYIEGRLQTRSWDDRNTGEKRYITEVVAQEMIILSPKSDRVPAVDMEEADVREVGSVREAGSASRRAAAPSALDAPAPAANGPVRASARTPARNTQQSVGAPDLSALDAPAPAANGSARARARTPARNTPQLIEEDDIPF